MDFKYIYQRNIKTFKNLFINFNKFLLSELKK